MKGLKQSCFIAAALVVTGSACASSWKVGTVDIQKVFASPDGAPKIQAKLEKKFSSQREELQKLLEKLQAEQKSYQKNKTTWSKDTLAKKEKKFKEEQQLFQKQQVQYQQAFSAAQGREMDKLLKSIKSAAKKVAKKDKLRMVLVKNSVLYAQDTTDVTDEILDKWSN